MTKQFIKDAFGWGFILWFIGYALGVLFFAFLPMWLIGWIILPIGVAITYWVLFRKIKSSVFSYYFLLAIVWTLLAVFCDYFFLVKAFKPADGYYKLDVYLYYLLTFGLPIFVGWRKAKNST